MPYDEWDLFLKMCEYRKVSFMALGKRAPLTNCKVVKIPTPAFTAWYGFHLRTNSPYTKIFNRV